MKNRFLVKKLSATSVISLILLSISCGSKPQTKNDVEDFMIIASIENLTEDSSRAHQVNTCLPLSISGYQNGKPYRVKQTYNVDLKIEAKTPTKTDEENLAKSHFYADAECTNTIRSVKLAAKEFGSEANVFISSAIAGQVTVNLSVDGGGWSAATSSFFTFY